MPSLNPIRSAQLIAPSLLSADFAHLADEIQAVEAAGADWIHLDVMDGRFVPNITFGPPVVAALRKVTALPLDVHLMIVEPERYLQTFADAGADVITIHREVSPHVQRSLAQIRELGLRAGLALNPGTSLEGLRYLAGDIDVLLCMSVNPGFGGQVFLPAALDKVREARVLLDTHGGRDAVIEVDGGVDASKAAGLTQAGASVLVAGSAVFGQGDYGAAIAALRRAGAAR